MIALTRSFALRCGSPGVTVNAVAPGWVETRLAASIPREERGGTRAPAFPP